MQFKKHVHADLIKEYARQFAEGELQCFCWEYYSETYNNWFSTENPSFYENDVYRFRMLETHPDYLPELELGDEIQSEHFTGILCQIDNKFYIIGTKNEGFAGAAQYVNSIGLPLLSEGYESLEKLAAKCKDSKYKIRKVKN